MELPEFAKFEYGSSFPEKDINTIIEKMAEMKFISGGHAEVYVFSEDDRTLKRINSIMHYRNFGHENDGAVIITIG